MEKGLLILVSVLAVAALINFGAIRIMNIAEEKKASYRKVFWYIYGVIFSMSGCINLFTNNEFNVIFIFQLAGGFSMLVLNFLGKIETKNPT